MSRFLITCFRCVVVLETRTPGLNHVLLYHNRSQIHLLKGVQNDSGDTWFCIFTVRGAARCCKLCQLENQLGSIYSAHGNPPFCLLYQAARWPDFPGMWRSLIDGSHQRGSQTTLKVSQWENRSSPTCPQFTRGWTTTRRVTDHFLIHLCNTLTWLALWGPDKMSSFL